MPITAKLSSRFYEKLGDEVTNELVNWLNAVDDTYRTEFRDLFAAHFGRLEATVERQGAELRADMTQHRTETRESLTALRSELRAELAEQGRAHQQALVGLDARVASIERVINGLDGRFAAIDSRFQVQEASMRAAISESEARMSARLLKHSIGTVAATVLSLLGIVGVLVRAGVIQ
jgi:hypothetical protein